MSTKHISGRGFLAATTAAVAILPRRVLEGPGHTSPGADFEYWGLLAEACLLGNVAKRLDTGSNGTESI